jgi:prevent-host-death family protein
MIREAPAMTVRQKFGEFLNEVQYRRGRVVITKAGKPVAALVDMAMFKKIRRLDEEFERMKDDMAKAFAEVSVEQGVVLVDEAVRKARKQKRIRK